MVNVGKYSSPMEHLSHLFCFRPRIFVGIFPTGFFQVLPMLVMGHNSTKAGDILGTMLGASPPAPPPLAEIAPELVGVTPPVATVAPVIQTPPALPIVPNAPACTTDLSTLIFIVSWMVGVIFSRFFCWRLEVRKHGNIWVFPKIMVPPNHPLIGFPL